MHSHTLSRPEELRSTLLDVAELIPFLPSMQAKSRTSWPSGYAGGSSSGDRPLPYDERVADVTRRLGDLADLILKPASMSLEAKYTVMALGAHHIVEREDAEFILVGIGQLVEDLIESFGKKPPRTYLGPCSMFNADRCRQDLYVEWDCSSGIVYCPACETGHDIRQRRDELFKAALSLEVTAAQAVDTLHALGLPSITRGFINGLINRYGIEPVGCEFVTVGNGGTRSVRSYRMQDIYDRIVSHRLI